MCEEKEGDGGPAPYPFLWGSRMYAASGGGFDCLSDLLEWKDLSSCGQLGREELVWAQTLRSAQKRLLPGTDHLSRARWTHGGAQRRSGQPITASLAQRWRDVLLDLLRETPADYRSRSSSLPTHSSFLASGGRHHEAPQAA